MNEVNWLDAIVRPVCGFPGVGKSHAAALHGWPDSDSSGFSWITQSVRHPEWPANYIAHLRGLNGVVMVSTHSEVRDALHAAGIEYALCYPERGCMAEYIERYEKRGSSLGFCALIAANWNEWLANLENDTRARLHVVLKPGQYASDIDWANTSVSGPHPADEQPSKSTANG